ncbi:unnamed protein product [Spirodela intermedia]|uniref:Glycosyltransferase n=1 Tax=Spirodela intermedia TaxID=51605 RepID=A0A7I8IZI1_SPIIN|nr:unnamed protein product [Spirodela intermedia]CAA6662561.1 unnamed protein product [Spirodela intermedia]
MARQPHIVLFPLLAQGHIIAFLALAKLIARRYSGRFTVTIVSTPLNVRSLRQSLPPESGVLLREIPFRSADHGLPPDTENTDSVTGEGLEKLLGASASLRPQFERLIAEEITREDGRPPLCIIADVFFGWTVQIAEKLGVFHAVFTTCGAFGTAMYFSMWLHRPHRHTTAEEFWVPGFPEGFRFRRSQLPRSLTSLEDGSFGIAFMTEHITLSMSSKAMLCNTVEGLEPVAMALLRKIAGLRVWSVGAVVPLETTNSSGRRAGRMAGVDPETCLRWLDAHPPRSVLYVSFGSQNSVSAPQMMALARGLEATAGRFDIKGEFKDEWLPEGFEDRTGRSGRGLLVRNWAPQLEILSHPSVGGFLSHCGWNSVLESLSRGVPLIGWPMAAEQFYNSNMLEELGVCAELGRGVEQRVSSVEVERVVGLVLGGEKGEDMRRKAASAAKTMRAASEEGEEKGSSIAALDNFLATVLGTTPPDDNRYSPSDTQ